MSDATPIIEYYEPRLNPLNRAIAVLERQSMDTAGLRSLVDWARAEIHASNAAPIQSLLDGMSRELNAVATLLQRRIASLSAGSARDQTTAENSTLFWRFFRMDASDCAIHLQALLSSYVHFARGNDDSIAFLQVLGDTESVRLLERITDVAKRGIWFIELYIEGLALRMDTARLPEFNPVIGVPIQAETDAPANKLYDAEA